MVNARKSADTDLEVTPHPESRVKQATTKKRGLQIFIQFIGNHPFLDDTNKIESR